MKIQDVLAIIESAEASLDVDDDAYVQLLGGLITNLKDALCERFQVTSVNRIVGKIDLPEDLLSKVEEIQTSM